MAEGSRKRTAQNNLHNQRLTEGLLLCIVIILGVIFIRCCVHTFAEKERQLQSLVAEKERIIADKERIVAEKERIVADKERIVAEKERLVAEKEHIVAEKERIVAQYQRFLPAAAYTCHVSGPGLSATANYPTHVIVELIDISGQPCSLRQNVTAELQSVDQSSVVSTTVLMISISQYEVSYTALSRGQYKFYVRLNGSEVSGSPFNIFMYPDPTQLNIPVRVFTGLNEPWGIAINSHGDIVVSKFEGHTFFLLDREGKRYQTRGIPDSIPTQTTYTTGIAVDSDDNIYVASGNKLHKFSVDSQRWSLSKSGKIGDPKGITFHQGHVYVCDRANNHIQVFDSDLKFIRTIGSLGSGKGEFDEPYGLDFDGEGKVYVSDKNNHRIQVMNTRGQVVQQFGQEEGKGKLKWPTAVHIMGQFVYISDWGHNRIAVYQTSGQFVTTFGRQGNEEGELNKPYSITSNQTGFLFVADSNNNRVQVF